MRRKGKRVSLIVCQRGACDAPRLNAARLLARLVDLKAALLAEARARGPDGPRMRLPQLARCSRDQLRRRMGQHGAALGLRESCSDVLTGTPVGSSVVGH